MPRVPLDRHTSPNTQRVGGRISGAAAFTQPISYRASHPRQGDSRPHATKTPQKRKNLKKAEQISREAAAALESRRYKMAEQLYESAMSLLADVPLTLWINRLSAASKAGNYDYVVDNYQRIRAMAARDEELAIVDHVWVDCLVAAGYFQEALNIAKFWLSRHTSSSSAIRSVVGVIYAELGDLEEAITIQKSILTRDPSNVLAKWHLSLHQMEAGHLPDALEAYEARWQLPSFPSERRTFEIPRWQGEPLDNKRILVWREQGIGDEIRFSGLLPNLSAQVADVRFECSPKLVPLFRQAFPDLEVCPTLPKEHRHADDYLGFDFEVPIGSLARIFRPTVAAMDASAAAWLPRRKEAEDRAREAMNAAPHQPIIGLCWRSSLRNLRRDRNFLRPEHLSALKLLGKSAFICLQYDECREEVELIQELGLPMTYFASIDQMNDLVGASELAGACDLVISAPTATADLSAALGVPTLIFGEKRYPMQLGTDKMPWYPATRCLSFDNNDPMQLVKSILFNWDDLASWAEKNSISGRDIDWRLSYPG